MFSSKYRGKCAFQVLPAARFEFCVHLQPPPGLPVKVRHQNEPPLAAAYTEEPCFSLSQAETSTKLKVFPWSSVRIEVIFLTQSEKSYWQRL